ncbi:MAG: dCTP deaminase, partial [Micrococcales bacterium]|nr:dCTP deaminase [Micrococcales bacterium]
YQGQRGPTASRSYLNFYKTDVGNEPLEQQE